MKIKKVFTVKPDHGAAELGDAFGIPGTTEITVLDIELPDVLPDITLITGESGCGKSTLLNELGGDNIILPPASLKLWEYGGEDSTKTLQFLGHAGLCEATLFFLNYTQLSDSQKFRAGVAYTLLMGVKELRCDEFLSTLDRKTAKALAFSVQKMVRKLGVKLVACTAHDDIASSLQAELVIKGKAWPSRWEVKRRILKKEEFPITIREGTARDYGASTLGSLHYRGKHVGGIKKVLIASVDKDDVGIIVATYRMGGKGGLRLTRLIVHPSYRGLGIGRRLIERVLSEVEDVDAVLSMGKYNPMCEKAGMKKIKETRKEASKKLQADLAAEGFDLSMWVSKDYCEKMVQDLSIRKAIAKHPASAARFVCPGGKRISNEELVAKIEEEDKTAFRALWGRRPHTSVKYTK